MKSCCMHLFMLEALILPIMCLISCRMRDIWVFCVSRNPWDKGSVYLMITTHCQRFNYIQFSPSQGFQSCCVLLPVSWGCILKFPVIKNINDETPSQCSGIRKDHGPLVPGTYKALNNFEYLPSNQTVIHIFISQALILTNYNSLLHSCDKFFWKKKCTEQTWQKFLITGVNFICAKYTSAEAWSHGADMTKTQMTAVILTFDLLTWNRTCYKHFIWWMPHLSFVKIQW